MKKYVVFILVISVVIFRILIIEFFKTDPVFYLSPRSFNGRGLLTMPALLDFLLPILIVIIVLKQIPEFKIKSSKLAEIIGSALVLVIAPLLTGLLLNNYIQKYLIRFEFNTLFLYRYILLILTFIAINEFANSLKIGKKSIKYLVLFIFIAALALTQDLFKEAGPMYIVLGLISSVGVSTGILALGLRNHYKSNPYETTIAVSIVGVFITFLVFNVLSVSFFTIFLPYIGMFITALSLYSNWSYKTKIITVSSPLLLALFLNYGLPNIVSAEFRKELIERKSYENLITEKVGTITVKYQNQKLRELSIKFAKVIDAANKISKAKFGISPEVKELVITGIGSGGFHAEYPNRIVGTIISEQYIANCSDSLFLNNPDLSPNFPDPVNAILHEYSHLYGLIPYHKWWPGAEEEGWASFSATRLASLLFEQNKEKQIWKPAYNFKKQADKINELNLSGKSVVWSHANEFGGYILWQHIEQRYGLKELYTKRWKHTKRNINASLYYYSNPKDAEEIVNVFGQDLFKKYGNMKAKLFREIYSLNDFLILAKTTGIKIKKIKKLYKIMENRMVNPQVPIP